MNNNHGNKFFDGLLWGAILGGGLVFLLGTKKGKKILKMITEEGVEGLSEILEAQMDEDPPAGEAENLEEEEEMEDGEKVPEEPLLRGNGVSKNPQSKESQEEIRPPQKRFFRKTSK